MGVSQGEKHPTSSEASESAPESRTARRLCAALGRPSGSGGQQFGGGFAREHSAFHVRPAERVAERVARQQKLGMLACRETAGGVHGDRPGVAPALHLGVTG